MKDNKADTFCVMAHHGFYLEPTRHVKPCCVFKDFDEPVIYDENKSFDEMYNSHQFKDLRNKLDNGIVHKGCEECFNGRTDFREQMNNSFYLNGYIDGKTYSEISDTLMYLDLRASNQCNFKCRMCNDDYSTQWQKELEKIVENYEPKVRNLKGDWLQPLYEKLGDVKFLYLAGGEPFIIPQTFQLLDIFHSKKNEITLFINTNLSNLFYKDVDILDVISKYKQTHLMISCDGFGEIGEYQRTGFKTERFKENLHKVIEKTKSSDIQIQIVHALTSLNIWNIFKFLDELKSEFGLDDSVVNIQNVQNPWYYSVSYGSSQYKNKVESFIKENYSNFSERTKQQLDSFIRFIIKNDLAVSTEMKLHHYNEIKKIDEYRNTDINDILPNWEMDFFKEILTND